MNAKWKTCLHVYIQASISSCHSSSIDCWSVPGVLHRFLSLDFNFQVLRSRSVGNRHVCGSPLLGSLARASDFTCHSGWTSGSSWLAGSVTFSVVSPQIHFCSKNHISHFLNALLSRVYCFIPGNHQVALPIEARRGTMDFYGLAMTWK